MLWQICAKQNSKFNEDSIGALVSEKESSVLLVKGFSFVFGGVLMDDCPLCQWQNIAIKPKQAKRKGQNIHIFSVRSD